MTPGFEAKVLDKEDQFTKVRVTYNQDYLPIKLEWYFKGKDGLKWNTWSRFSYPYKTESEFNKKLDEEIKIRKAMQKEQEQKTKAILQKLSKLQEYNEINDMRAIFMSKQIQNILEKLY